MKRFLQMKRVLRTALLVLLLSVIWMEEGDAQNYDFSAVCETGQTLYYRITDATNHHAMLTYPGYEYYPWISPYMKPSGDIVLPENVYYNGIDYEVTAIDDHTFQDCSDLTGDLVIPNSVITIGERAFQDCSGFTGTLSIGNSLTSIGTMAFCDCDGLTGTLVLNHSLISIGYSAFLGCSGFSGTLVIPNTLRIIESGAFSNCSGIEHIIVEEGNPWFDSRNNCDAIISSGDHLMVGCRNTIIPNSVVAISDNAFEGHNLSSISIPNSVTYIGWCAFMYCSSLNSITIPNSVIVIQPSAFEFCVGLTSINIPNSVEYIGEYAFSSCSGLEQITVEDGNPFYDSRDNCNALIETSSNILLQGCRNTVIPNTVTKIGNEAFLNCTALTTIDIPNSVTEIGITAFGNCSELSGILKIPNSVFSIENGAFYMCGFDSVVSLAETPPNLGYGAFDDVPCSTLIVPCHCIPTYEASEWHNHFTTIVEDCTSLEENDESIISIYPNPTASKINIEAEGLKHITISNMLGQVVYDGNASGDTFEYDFDKHNAGLYFIRIETANGVTEKKVTVKR